MLFNTRIWAVMAIVSTIASGLPLDHRDFVPRQKSYEVINVDGGSSTKASSPETTIVKATQTVEVVNPGPTITQEVTATIIQPAPASTSSSSKCTSSASRSSTSSTPSVTSSPSSTVSTPTETPKPVFVTVTVPVSDGPTEYYDDGMWHTKYPVKTFAAAVATSLYTASSSTELPVLETPLVSYNETTA